MHQPFTDCGFWPLLNWKLWFSFENRLILHLHPPRKSILRLEHKIILIHTFRFRPWKSFNSMNCTFPIVVFFLLHCPLWTQEAWGQDEALRHLRSSDVHADKRRGAVYLWPLSRLRILTVLLRSIGLRKWWTLILTHTAPLWSFPPRLFHYFRGQQSHKKKINKKTWTECHFMGAVKVMFNPGSGQRRSNTANPALFSCMWAFTTLMN